MTLTYGSVCSGIEATTVAWDPLGMRPKFFAEIDDFCSAVLTHHYPEVPNLGDFTQIGPEHGPVDVLVGGTPCQSFSQAGGRAGIRDPRGNMAIEFLLLAARLSARWVVFENVPGLLFSGDDGGRRGEDDAEIDAGGEQRSEPRPWLDFGTFLGAMGQLGFGFAYRILDAQHCGVAQRRRRVFVVGRAGGDWRAAAAVLFERESLRRTHPPRRTERSHVAKTLAARAPDRDPDFSGPGNPVAGTLMGGHDPSRDGLVVVTPPLMTRPYADHGQQGHLVYNVQPKSASVEKNTLVAKETEIAECLSAIGPKRRCDRGDLVVTPTLTTRHDAGVFVEEREPLSFDPAQITHRENRSKCEPGSAAPTLSVSGRPHVAHRSLVRHLTPLEYERLQGFPDGYTLIPFRGKPAVDGRRYKAVGNSMAVPVMRWIGARILLVETLIAEAREDDAGA